MAATTEVIWLCACIRYWPYRRFCTCAPVLKILFINSVALVWLTIMSHLNDLIILADHLLATAAGNGAIVLWNLNKITKQKQGKVPGCSLNVWFYYLFIGVLSLLETSNGKRGLFQICGLLCNFLLIIIIIIVITIINREFKIRRLRTTNYGWTSVLLCL